MKRNALKLKRKSLLNVRQNVTMASFMLKNNCFKEIIKAVS